MADWRLVHGYVGVGAWRIMYDVHPLLYEHLYRSYGLTPVHTDNYHDLLGVEKTVFDVQFS